MNRLQKHKWLMAIGICVAIILSGIATAVLSLKLGFPTAWVKSGFFVSFAGSGGIGVVIALYVHSIPHQDKYHRKRLEAKAWKELGMHLFSLATGGVSVFYLIAHYDEMEILRIPPVKITVLSVIIALGVWMAVGPFIMKKRLLKGLDERERLINEKAKMISDSIFGGLSMAGFLGLFVWFGPKWPIPVFVPVLMFFALAFIAEIVKPLVILIQCKMEQAEGGVA